MVDDRTRRTCGRCRALILDPAESVTVRIGTFPPRLLCTACAEHVQLECVRMPALNASVPCDLTPH